MLKTDYSQDTKLLDWEFFDYDTKNLNETGINRTRMRLPDRYDISKYYRRLKRNVKATSYNPYTGEYETVTRRKGEYGEWKDKKEEDLLDFSDDFDWQITYSFPNEIHNNVSPNGHAYGGYNVTYRRLYLILCERLNAKEYFIDTYFRDVYPFTMKETVDVELGNLKDELLSYASDVVFEGAKVTKKGKLDKRYKDTKMFEERLNEYESFAGSWEDSKGEELADLIKEDIIRCLENGQIPLKHTNTSSTLKKRHQSGYTDDEQVFYAMGDLINHIQLFIKIGGKGWETRQGLVV